MYSVGPASWLVSSARVRSEGCCPQDPGRELTGLDLVQAGGRAAPADLRTVGADEIPGPLTSAC
jgi:hypothetical protein